MLLSYYPNSYFDRQIIRGGEVHKCRSAHNEVGFEDLQLRYNLF